MGKSISKSTFNSMTIEQQVNFFNGKLYEGEKITKICEEINISYNTVRDRFKRNNFIFNKQLRQYECVESIFQYDDETIEKALEKVVAKIFESKSSTDIENLLICDFKGKVVNRSFRIYGHVLKDFTTFCNNSNYNQYDILSKFIVEGMQRYNNIV